MRLPRRLPLPVRRALRRLPTVATLAVAATLTTGLAVAAAQPAAAVSRWVLGYERVQAHGTDRLTVRTQGAKIWVTGDHSTDLDCWLYRNGSQIDSDMDDTDVCLLYTDGSGGPFILRVHNYGNVYNDYTVEAEN